MTGFQIRKDDLSGPEIVALLGQHLGHMQAITPPQSVHALGLDALRAPEVSVWSIWEGRELLGCGALRALDDVTGEIKSMRTVDAHRRRGVASRMLAHIIAEARRRGYRQLHLETGALPAFAAARAFYRSHGFEPRGPFADYREDPNSLFLTRVL